MKKSSIVIILSLFICISSMFSSCNYFPTENPTDTSQNETAISTNERIKELEAQIIALLQSQQISESERKQEISVLKAELDSLKKSESENSSNKATDETAPKIFNYTLNGYKVTITSINTDEESISIPSIIDGHAVTAIGSEVIKSSKIKRIVLEDGEYKYPEEFVEKIRRHAVRHLKERNGTLDLLDFISGKDNPQWHD